MSWLRSYSTIRSLKVSSSSSSKPPVTASSFVTEIISSSSSPVSSPVCNTIVFTPTLLADPPSAASIGIFAFPRESTVTSSVVTKSIVFPSSSASVEKPYPKGITRPAFAVTVTYPVAFTDSLRTRPLPSAW